MQIFIDRIIIHWRFNHLSNFFFSSFENRHSTPSRMYLVAHHTWPCSTVGWSITRYHLQTHQFLFFTVWIIIAGVILYLMRVSFVLPFFVSFISKISRLSVDTVYLLKKKIIYWKNNISKLFMYYLT